MCLCARVCVCMCVCVCAHLLYVRVNDTFDACNTSRYAVLEDQHKPHCVLHLLGPHLMDLCNSYKSLASLLLLRRRSLVHFQHWRLPHCLWLSVRRLQVATTEGGKRLVCIQLPRCEANAVWRRGHHCTGLFTEKQQGRDRRYSSTIYTSKAPLTG